jgi:hypothetical protein
VSLPASHDPESLLARLHELARELDTRRISRSTWVRATGINDHHVIKHFDSWNGFVRAAGLIADDRSRLSDDELFEAMRAAFLKAGGIVTRTAFRKVCRYSDDAYAKRWGRWPNVLARFRSWADMNAPDFPYLDDLPRDSLDPPTGRTDTGSSPVALAWTSTQRTQYGPFLNFRGLQHAPINEQGVVFLFGIVAFDLGYVVEGVGTGFPDCEAKRCVSKAGDVWERVRIEFEFRSRNFVAHGHDPAACDVIVCWEDNWPDSPVEVLELRSAIESLSDDGA